MKTALKLEEAAMAFAGIYFLYLYDLGLPAWAWVLLFFAPDLGMIGYVINNKAGAITYNFLHHKALALGLALIGYFMNNEVLIATGALLFAHSSFDRMLGYGLKYYSGFKNTHLGEIGKKEIQKG
jgi:hypothetical protein